MSDDLLNVTIADGKYTVVQDAAGRLSALRYGQPWRDCCGDSLIFSLASELTAALDARKTAEQELEKNRTSFKICCGAAGVADESELCGAIDRMKQRAEDAEKACALLRQEVFETRCFDLKGACSAGGHGKRDAEIVAIVNERLDAEIQSAGRDYVHKSKLEAAEKACKAMRDAWDKYDSNSSTWADTDHCRKVHQDCKVGSPASFPSQPSPQPRK